MLAPRIRPFIPRRQRVGVVDVERADAGEREPFRNADRTLSRNYIMETIWRTTAALATRTLDMHISRVRSKLDLQPENGFRIFTVFGYGYRLSIGT